MIAAGASLLRQSTKGAGLTMASNPSLRGASISRPEARDVVAAKWMPPLNRCDVQTRLLISRRRTDRLIG